jgi:hypothetical protein
MYELSEAVFFALFHLPPLLPPPASPSSSSSKAGPVMSYAARADAILAAFADRIEGAGIAMPQMCAAAWMRLHTPLRQVSPHGKAHTTKFKLFCTFSHGTCMQSLCRKLILRCVFATLLVTWMRIDASLNMAPYNFNCQQPVSDCP